MQPQDAEDIACTEQHLGQPWHKCELERDADLFAELIAVLAMKLLYQKK